MYFSREHIDWWGIILPDYSLLRCPNTVILKDLYELFCNFLTSVYLKVQASCGYKIFMDKTGIDR